MQFNVTTTDSPRIRTGCLVAGVFEGLEATPAYQALDAASGGKLDAIARKARFRGDTGKHLLVHALDGVAADSVLIVGCGPKKEAVTAVRYLKLAGTAARTAVGTGARSLAWSFGEIDVDDRDLEWKSRIAIERLSDAAYRFDTMRSDAVKDRTPAASTNVDRRLAQPPGDGGGRHRHRTGDRRGHCSRARPRKPARQRLYPEPSRRPGQGARRTACEGHLQGARRGPDETPGHGLAAVGGAREP